MGQEMSIFSAPQGVPVGQEMITFSAPQRVCVGQEMITFSAPQESLWGRKRSFFLPHRDRPQDITTSIKHCNLQCFLFPPRTKQRYLRCFLFREHQNRVKTLVFYDVLATAKNASVAKTPLFATLWQHNMSEMLYFTVFLEHLFKNTGIYSVL